MPSSANALAQRISDVLINPLLALFTVLAVLLFVWGAVQFIANAESEEGRTIGKRHIIWGLVGLVIIVSVLGILKILLNTFGASLP